jgi:hypothetical protein
MLTTHPTQRTRSPDLLQTAGHVSAGATPALRIASRSEADVAGHARAANKFKTRLSARLERTVRRRQYGGFIRAVIKRAIA